MQPSMEFSIDLTAQELLAPFTPAGMVEVDDICAVDPLLRTGSFAANSDAPAELTAADREDSVEIELTAEQMNALLEGALLPVDGYQEG
ncbi:MAG: hypothetical protein ACREV5_14390 [Steroidobacter sp.]